MSLWIGPALMTHSKPRRLTNVHEEYHTAHILSNGFTFGSINEKEIEVDF
jgi:hypothetical protein